MTDGAKIVLGVGAFAGMVAAAFVATRVLDDHDEAKAPRPKQYRRTLAEGLTVNRHGVYGLDFVRLGACRVEKLRKGIMTFGGLNVLVLEDLSVVLPEADPSGGWSDGLMVGSSDGRARSPNAPQGRAARSVSEPYQHHTTIRPSDDKTIRPSDGKDIRPLLARMGVGESFLLARGVGNGFSAVRVEGLCVARQEGTNAVPLFAAAQGETKGRDFVLRGCTVLADGASNNVGRARLTLRGGLRLEWTGGSLNLDDFVTETTNNVEAGLSGLVTQNQGDNT